MALDPVGLAPLVGVLAVLGVLGVARVAPSWDRAITRYSRRLFGRYVGDSAERSRTLRSAYVDQTYRAYASRTLLFTALGAIGGAIAGVYAVGAALLAVPATVELLMGLPPTMITALGLWDFEMVLTERQTLSLLTGGGVLGGLVTAGLTYLLRWELPKNAAAVRQRNIDEGMPRLVAFMYALSRGGVEFPVIVRTLGRNAEIYGEGAREMNLVVREMDLFGRDMITAVRRMTERTPSEEFKTFSENLASVLQSGQNLPSFLRDQYDRYQEAAEDHQEEILERLATVAEVYVTVLVAGVLFFITILLVFGLTTTDTLWLLQLLAYVAIPLGNVGFAVFLQRQLDALGIAGSATAAALRNRATTVFGKPPGVGDDGVPAESAATADPRTDGGGTAASESLLQLRLYDRYRRFNRVLRSPVETIRWDPARLLYVTVPLALAYVALRAPPAFAAEGVSLRLLDDVVVQAVLFVLGSYAVVRELYVRRIRRIEAATPEVLERLASLNEAGMTVVESVERVRGSDVGALTREVERIWADVSLGANVEDAFVRFGRRVRTTAITRVVTLLVNAMRASGKLGVVLRIAATQARADVRLRRRRQQQMFTYLVVIYISFLVFLVIIGAVQEVLVPALPAEVPTPDNTGRLGVNADQFARLGSVDKAAYTLVFFHTALIQSVLSGFVGGQLGEGSLRDGAKHAAVMLGVAYVAFVLLSSPVASITVEDPAVEDGSITVDSVSLSEGGFVALYDRDRNGTRLGESDYLRAGTHSDVEITLDRPPNGVDPVVAVAYRDSDGDYALTRGPAAADRPYDSTSQGRVVSVTVID